MHEAQGIKRYGIEPFQTAIGVNPVQHQAWLEAHGDAEIVKITCGWVDPGVGGKGEFRPHDL